MSEEVRLPGFPELRRRGFEALVRELGAANALRFLHRSRDPQGFWLRFCLLTRARGERWRQITLR